MYTSNSRKSVVNLLGLDAGDNVALFVHPRWISWVYLDKAVNRLHNIDHNTYANYTEDADLSIRVKWDSYGEERFHKVEDYYVFSELKDQFIRSKKEHFETMRLQYEPWRKKTVFDLVSQQRLQANLEEFIDADFGKGSYVSEQAHVVADQLQMGAFSWIAADCLIRGNVTIGPYSGINFGVVIAGSVAIGENTQIASGSAIYGFNHNYKRGDVPMTAQGCTIRGIKIGDDVWVGANVVIVDGVTIGSHSVLAAGAVVNRDVPDFALVAGVPAKVIGDKRTR